MRSGDVAQQSRSLSHTDPTPSPLSTSPDACRQRRGADRGGTPAPWQLFYNVIVMAAGPSEKFGSFLTYKSIPATSKYSPKGLPKIKNSPRKNIHEKMPKDVPSFTEGSSDPAEEIAKAIL